MNQIKDEGGALLGRYIISSTITAQFNHPASIFDIPCALCITCGAMNNIDENAVAQLANYGCQAVIVCPRARAMFDSCVEYLATDELLEVTLSLYRLCVRTPLWERLPLRERSSRHVQIVNSEPPNFI